MTIPGIEPEQVVGSLYYALALAYAEMPAIAKASTNPHFKSKFCSLDDIITVVRPVLAKHGLAILQSGTLTDDGKALNVETRIIHRDGGSLVCKVAIPIAKMDPQGAGSALTYGRRYGLAAALCLSCEEDDDGNRANAPRPAAKRETDRRYAPPPRTAPASAPDDAADFAEEYNQTQPKPATKKPADLIMPAGAPVLATIGKRLGDCSVQQLNETAAWCKKPENKGKAALQSLLKAVQLVATDKALGPEMAHEGTNPFPNDVR